MSRRHVVTFLTAPARSGKSYNEVRKICDEYLQNPECHVYTNLPLHTDRISEWAAKRHGITEESVFERFHVIPREIELDWMNAGQAIYDPATGKRTGNNQLTGPWEYFADKELSGAVIIIDEIHNFCGSIGTIKAISNLWQKWLGELGHNQAVFRCLSQSPEKVHSCIKQEAQASYSIRNTGLDRDPYFKIEIYDWLELWAGIFGGSYTVYVFEQETMKIEGKRVKGERKLHPMGQPYFDFYDSFNKPIAHGQTLNVQQFEPEYVKRRRKGFIRGRLSLLRWFLFKNFYNVVSRFVIVAALLVGGVYLANGGMGDLSLMISETLNKAVKVGVKTAAVNPAPSADAVKEIPSVVPSAMPIVKGGAESLDFVRKMYEEELRRALTEKETLTVELEATQKSLGDMSAVVMFTPQSIVTRKGYEYGVGEHIDYGEHSGKKVAEINYRQRRAVLDDGTVLHLSDERLRGLGERGQAKPGDGAGAGVQAVLPGS